jgi:hypothetical protein
MRSHVTIIVKIPAKILNLRKLPTQMSHRKMFIQSDAETSYYILVSNEKQ